jgi:hypothetical protein
VEANHDIIILANACPAYAWKAQFLEDGGACSPKAVSLHRVEHKWDGASDDASGPYPLCIKRSID